MPYTIYVPQGRSARLDRRSVSHGINGLFTEGFTNCHIIICIGKDKLSLIHFDRLTEEKNFIDEIAWVDKPREVIVIYKYENILGPIIQCAIGEKFPHQEILIRRIDTKDDGVFVSFQEQSQTDIHKLIKIYPDNKRVDDLLHHPQERQFLAIHKLRQMIGNVQRKKTRIFPDVQFCVFDGFTWAVPKDTELTFSPAESKEIDVFKKDDPLMELRNKFSHVYGKTLTQEEEMMGIPELVTYLQDYLHHYQGELTLLKRDLLDSVEFPKKRSATTEDIAYKDSMFALTQDPKSTYKQIADFIEFYRRDTPVTQYKQDAMKEVAFLEELYQRRMAYVADEKARVAKKSRGNKLATQANKHYTIDKNYSTACALYKEAMLLFSQLCLRNEKEIVITYHNYARALQRLGNYYEALVYFEYTLSLKTLYSKTPAELESTTKAIAVCKEALSDSKKQESVEESDKQNVGDLNKIKSLSLQ